MSTNRKLVAVGSLLVAMLIVIFAVVFFVNDDEEDDSDGGEISSERQMSVSSDAVAILVVDAFDPPPDFSTPELKDTDNCLVTPDGQGHAFIDGAGHAFIDGAGGYAELTSHGEVVYDQFQELLQAQNGALQDGTYGQAAFGVEWIRLIQQWELPDGEVLLVGVDTEGYTTAALATNIPDAMNRITNEYGINSFVLNLSFAVVPCGLLDETPDEDLLQRYIEILEEEFPELAEVFNSLVDKYDGNVIMALNDPTFTEGRSVIQSTIMQANYVPFYEDRAAYFDGDLKGCLESQGQKPPDGPSCENPFFPDDALYLELETMMERSTGNNHRIIQVGSAGNTDMPFPFAPAFYPTVISVSAEFSGANFQQAQPTSNDGEVQMNGLHTFNSEIYAGTSFAAPRLSVEAAIYLLKGGTTSCTGSVDNSAPPMAHPIWDNLPRTDAADQYCTDFNNLVP